MPFVARVPYYAPPPGFGGYSQGQQHPQLPQQMFGQMPQGAHPAAMPVSGMQPVPIGHMAPMPMPTMISNAIPTSAAPVSSVLQSEQGPSKLSCVDDKTEHIPMQNTQQMPIPRACWTPLEEEVLVKTYAEFTIGKKLKKINRKTWEAITQKLFQESKKHIPQVSMKSWMQCKDKWNNMIKKHKLHKSENSRGSLADASNMRERSTLYDAMEKVLCYESGTELADYTGQENQFVGEEDSVTMVVKTGELTNESETCGHEGLSPGLERGAAKESRERSAKNDMANAENGDGYEERFRVNRRTSNVYSDEFENDNNDHNSDDQENDDNGQGSVMYLQAIQKRRFSGHQDDGSSKRARMLDSEEMSMNEKLCQILAHQTELLERTHKQQCELMQQLRMSEENTRMLVVQAIKDLGTILHKLIKTEQF